VDNLLGRVSSTRDRWPARLHACVCVRVCLSVCLSLAGYPHYCANPDVTWIICNRCTGFVAMTTQPERGMSASACTRSIPGVICHYSDDRPVASTSACMCAGENDHFELGRAAHATVSLLRPFFVQPCTFIIITFRVSGRRREMYIGHARLCVCVCARVCVPRWMPTLLRGPRCNLEDLQSVHGLRCYDNIARTRNVSECLYSLYPWCHMLLWRRRRCPLALAAHFTNSVPPSFPVGCDMISLIPVLKFLRPYRLIQL